MMYTYLADAIVCVHFGFLAFTLGGQLLIFAGVLFRWNWVRNPWFRCIHLMAIVFVALEYAVGIDCPLTTWELDLRKLAGDPKFEEMTFVARWLNDIFFFEDLDPQHWAFGVGYGLFAALVLATFIFAPPRIRRRQVVAQPASIQSPAAPPHTGMDGYDRPAGTIPHSPADRIEGSTAGMSSQP